MSIAVLQVGGGGGLRQSAGDLRIASRCVEMLIMYQWGSG